MFRFGDDRGTLKCSFCGKAQHEVGKLIAGPGIYICDECIELCNEIIEDERVRVALKPEALTQDLLTGLQTRHDAPYLQPALTRLAGLVARHVTNPDHPRSHALLIGPTGCGKSALLRSLSEALADEVQGVPVARCDFSHYTPSGYFGRNVSDCLRVLWAASDYDLKRAGRGIVVLEHFDHREQLGEPRVGVYMELLRMLEGDRLEFDAHPGGRLRATDECPELDTSGILFLATGSFGLQQDSVWEHPRQALVEWGLSSSLVARFPNLICIPGPGVGDLLQILKHSPQVEGCSPDVVEALAGAAHGLGLGAWGLGHVLESVKVGPDHQADQVAEAAKRL